MSIGYEQNEVVSGQPARGGGRRAVQGGSSGFVRPDGGGAAVAEQASGRFHVGTTPPPVSWTSYLSFAGAVGFLERYGWFLLAAFVAASFLMPRFKRLVKKIDNNLNGEEHRRREARLDKQREQVRKKQAEAFEKRVQELEEQRRNDPCCNIDEREKRLQEINERAARLGFAKGERTKKSSRPEYNPLMGGDVPRYRTSRRAPPRGGG